MNTETKPFFAFLIGEAHHNEDLWAAYLALFPEGGYSVAAHCYQNYVGRLPLPVVPRVQTSWEKTMLAHKPLMNAFLATDCTHWILVSESCIPVAAPSKLLAALAEHPGKSLFTMFRRQQYERFMAARLPRPDKAVVDSLHSHEQWTILHRAHVETLVKNWPKIAEWFRRCNCGDNEHYTGTALTHFGHGGEIVDGRWFFTQWPKGRHTAHPDKIVEIHTARIAEFRRDGCLFARKIGEEWKGKELIYSELGTVMTEPKKEHVEILAHIHCFHPQHLKECVDALAAYPESTTLVVTYPQKNNECKEAIKTHCPNAEVIALPNRGRDVLPFLRVLQWAKKQGKEWKYVVKLHTKDHSGAKDWRRGWRTAMLNALKDWAKVRRTLSAQGVGIVGAVSMLWEPKRGAFWAAAGDVEKMQLASKAAGVDNAQPSPFFAGTIFAARWDAVAMWADAEMPEFEAEPVSGYGTLAHGMERAFGAVALAKGFTCVGI